MLLSPCLTAVIGVYDPICEQQQRRRRGGPAAAAGPLFAKPMAYDVTFKPSVNSSVILDLDIPGETTKVSISTQSHYFSLTKVKPIVDMNERLLRVFPVCV